MEPEAADFSVVRSRTSSIDSDALNPGRIRRTATRFLLLMGLTAAALWPSAAAAQEPHEECSAAASATWTAQETWVWRQLCARQVADLGQAGTFGSAGEVASNSGWSSERILRSGFITTILTLPTYTDHLVNREVSIIGAWFVEPVYMPGVHIEQSVFLSSSRFESDISLRGAQIDGAFGLDGSYVAGILYADPVDIGSNLYLREGAFNELDATVAHVGGNVELTSSTFSGEVDLDSATVGSNVFLNDVEAEQVVDMFGATVGSTVDANSSTFEQGLSLVGAQIGADVYVAGSTMHDMLDMTDTNVGGSLALSDREHSVSWRDFKAISLIGATADGIDDSRGAWPPLIHLEGFTLNQPYSQGYTSEDKFIDRPADWYLNWLNSDDSYTRSAYIMLENLLRASGRADEADAIGMERSARDAASSGTVKQLLSPVYFVTVGYGYHPEWALFWTVGLTMLGAFVALGVSRQDLEEKGAVSRVVLSAQRLIPLINFGQAYIDVDLTSRQVPRLVRWYFYLQAILGYVLAAALVAAVSGVVASE